MLTKVSALKLFKNFSCEKMTILFYKKAGKDIKLLFLVNLISVKATK